jgi:FkbM family methyltransferase
VRTDHGRFVVATSDGGTGWGLFVERGRPEFKVMPRAVAIVETLLGEDAIAGRVFIDIGANIGTATVAALVSHGFGSAVACEPEAENFRLLRVNLALNDLDDRVQALKVAASDRAGASDLVVLADRRGKSWVATDPETIRAGEASRAQRRAADPDLELRRRGGPRPEIEVVPVELTTLDLLAQRGIIGDRVGMMWIDAEGHEGHILAGAERLTDQGVPIVFEFHPANLDARGDRGRIQAIAEQCYTHFVDVRRKDRSEAPLRLRPVTELPDLAERLLDPGRFTDVLLLRLTAEQAGADQSGRRP